MLPCLARIFSIRSFLHTCLATLLLVLAGCANVHFEPGKTSLDDKSLVFGKILLVRSGEVAVLRASAAPIAIGDMLASGEPLALTESFEPSGRFYWSMEPGHYLLNITLSQTRGEVLSVAFTVPAKGSALYLGDLILTGTKRFDTIGGANIRDVRTTVEDNFESEKAELQKRNPALRATIARAEMRVINNGQDHQQALRRVLDQAPVCCASLRENRFEKLGMGSSRVLAAAADKGVFAFPEGKSLFAGAELPPYKEPYSIAVRSLVANSGIPFRFRVFVPTAVLLDEDFKVIQSHTAGWLRPTPASIMPPRAASLDGRIEINAANARARYLVFYTTDQLMGRSSSTTVPGILPVAGGALPIGPARSVGIVPWLGGRIEVSLSGGQK